MSDFFLDPEARQGNVFMIVGGKTQGNAAKTGKTKIVLQKKPSEGHVYLVVKETNIESMKSPGIKFDLKGTLYLFMGFVYCLKPNEL